MKSISKILVVLIISLSTLNTYAQIKNTQIAALKISGNCEMCEAAIEKAGNLKNAVVVNWNKDTKMATLTYDTNKTGTDEILKRIALAGYDNEQFLAPDEAYAKLPECCKYTRELKPIAKVPSTHAATSHEGHTSNVAASPQTQLQGLLDVYFSLKDALVNSDGIMAAQKATALVAAVKATDMNKLSTREHDVWMKLMKELLDNAQSISVSKDIAKQRTLFALLSKNVYELAKVSDYGNMVYYQHCPMFNDGKGANWLSKDADIKNPYYGSMMLTCGQTVETLK